MTTPPPTRVPARRSLTVAAGLFTLAACAAPNQAERAPRLRFLHESILRIEADASGRTHVQFGLSALDYVIDTATPDPRAPTSK